MFQIFITAILATLASSQFAAAEKTPQTLEEINADLKTKKSALEPFDEKKIKIDVESLGLDDVDKKPAAEEKKEVANPIVVQQEKPAEKIKTPAVEEKIIEEKKPETLPQTSAADIKKPTEKYINSTKKQNLKKRLEAEKQRKKNQKLQQEKLKKLNELRQKYLIKAEEKIENPDEDFESDEEKILPQKKEVNPFISDEMPALPILNRFRTKDNLHIPPVQNLKEKVDILFDAISMGSISVFNEAYKNVENSNIQNPNGDTILTYAILLKKYPIIASVLAKGADPDLPNKLGYTPVNIAIELLDAKSLELLADNKADLNYVDAFGRTYLMHAARVGFLPAVELLVAKGADVNAMDNDGFTALSIAYRHRKEVIVKFLLKNGAKTWIEKPFEPEEQSLIKELKNRWK